MKEKLLIISGLALLILSLVGGSFYYNGFMDEFYENLGLILIIVFGYSALAFFCTFSYWSARWFSITGIILSIAGLVWALVMILNIFGWSMLYDEGFVNKTMAALVILPIYFSHTSLLLIIDNNNSLVIGLRNAIIFLAGVLALSYFYGYCFDEDVVDGINKVGIGIVLIGTFIVLILNIVFPKKMFSTGLQSSV